MRHQVLRSTVRTLIACIRAKTGTRGITDPLLDLLRLTGVLSAALCRH